MVYEGFLKLGGVEIVNSERVRGYARTSDCYLPWLQGPECEALQDALGDSPYDFDNMPLAPWHDSSMPDVSGRFLGAFGLSVSGLDSSTRSSQSTEGIMDGGTLGRTRKGMMSARVRATLLAKGRDALDYGVAWLNAAIDANRCGQHGGGCGTTDMEFLADCPPARSIVREYTPWVEQRRNLLTNPSFETPDGTVELYRNTVFNPMLAGTAGGPTTVGGWALPSGTGVWGDEDGLALIADTAGSSALLPYQAIGVPAAPGEVWSQSLRVEVPSDSPSVTMRIALIPYAGVTTVGPYGYSPTVTIPSGGMHDFELTHPGLPDGTTSIRLIPYLMEEPGSGRKIKVSRALQVKSPVVPTYFDGSTQPRVRTNVVRNPAPSSAAHWAALTGASIAFEDDAIRVTANGASAHQGVQSTGVPSRPPETISGAIEVRAPDGALLYAQIRPNGSVTESVQVNFTGTGDWQRIETENAVRDPGGSSGTHVIMVRTASPQSLTFEVRRAIIEVGPTVGTYFDGSSGGPSGLASAWEGAINDSASYLYDPDLTPSWVGTPDASESVLTGVGVAGVAANSTNLAVYQSSDSPAHGTKVARYLASTTSALALSPSTVAPDVAGKTYTILIRARSRDRLEVATPRFGGVTAGVEGRKNLPPGEWVEWRYTATSVTPSAVSHGLYVYANPSRIRGEAIDVDAAVFVEGDYSGPYFDGNTPTQELAQYSWVGDEDASQSILEVRQPIDRLQDDAEYAVDVDALRRFLHDVSVTSGPLPVEHYSFRNPEGYFGVTMEWTITSERAWIYSKTRSVELPVTPTMIVQDAPFNLVPHPSAELASGTVVVATNYITNPSLESNDTGWSVSGPSHTAAAITGGRSSELAASGTHSYRARLLGNGAGGATNLSGEMSVRSEMADLSTVAGNPRPSFTVWAAGIVSGGQSGTTLESIKAEAEWWGSGGEGGGVMGYTTLNLESGGISGGVYTAPSTEPPAGATAVRFLVTAKYKYSSSATAANNTDLRLYVDAAAVTVP